MPNVVALAAIITSELEAIRKLRTGANVFDVLQNARNLK
jgi:hypothetical protein